MNNDKVASIDEQKSIAQIYAPPISDISRKADNLSDRAQKSAFYTIVYIVFMSVIIVITSLLHSFLLNGMKTYSDSYQLYKNLDQILGYCAVALVISTLLLAGRSYVNYNRSKRELRLFLKPLQALLQEVTALIDHGGLGQHVKLALRLQITEAEISLRRAEAVTENTLTRNGIGLEPKKD